MLTAKKNLLGILLLICLVTVAWSCSADSLTIPGSVSVIETEAFEGSGVSTVVIPASVQSIGDKAFANCSSLTDVYLPANAIDIAEDAFDVNGTTVFHVYMGSPNATWAREHDYQTEYISGGVTGDSWDQVNTLIATEPIGNKNADPFYTHRLIVKLSAGMALPDLAGFNPKAVIGLDNNRYVLQFNNSKDASDCFNAFQAMKGNGCEYCETDYFLSYQNDGVGASNTLTLRSAKSVNRDDPMGFRAYTEYIGDNVGHVTIAIIDDGVSGSLIGGNIVSNDSYDFINNIPEAVDGFGDSHGTKVANAICDAFGNLATSNHLSIISYRIENPSNGDISYLMMGEAIIQAKLDGADLVNISIAGESSYADEQDNAFLHECIDYFGSGSIIAAAGNRVVPASHHLPARYCGVKAGAAQFVSNDDDTLIRADGTATGASVSGFATTTSISAAKVTAVYALLRLGSESMGDDILEDVQDGAKMPNLALRVIKPVNSVILNDGDPIESILWVGDRASIDYEVLPSDATNKQVNVISENSEIVEILSNNYTSRVRIHAVAPGQARLVFSSDDGNVTVPVTITVVQPVTKVTVIGYNGETLMRGQTLALTAVVEPSNASDKTVTWSSSNNDIATVTQTGIVTQVGEGTVVITATSNFDPTKYGSTDPIPVVDEPEPGTVIVWAEGHITSMNIGASPVTIQMYSEVLPEGADQSVTWSVNPESIASIDDTGMITISGCNDPLGRDNVRVYAESYNGKVGYCDITVVQLPTSISISGANSVAIGETITLTATVNPANAANKNVRWISSNPNIATVTDGTVEGITSGNVMITALSAADGSVYEAFFVNVEVLPESVTITPPTSTVLDINDTMTLTATVSPDNTTNKNLRWTSFDSSVATVNETSGVVTAKASGTVTITVSTFNDKTDEITLTVRQPYTLTFDANGGSCGTSSKTAYSGYAVGSLPAPTRTGYTFTGWYRATGESAQVTDSTILTSSSSITLYAHWKANTYKVTLNNQSATSAGSTSVTATYNAAMPSITAPSKTGYTFKGYYTAQNGGGTQYYTAAGASARSWNLTSATTLYAYWTPNTYTVTLNNQSATSAGSTSVTATYNAAMPSITSPSKTGYTFKGYYTAQNGGGTQYYTAAGASARNWNLTSATTLYAYWTPITCTVTLNNQSATTAGSTSVTATYNAAMPSITSPAKTGYTFKGYYTAQNGGGTQYYTAAGASARSWNLTSATTLYAYWTPNDYTYSIVYKSSNGTSLGSTTMTKAYGSSATVTPPAYAGYTTPGAQTVKWDSTSKTITFTYSPVSPTVTSVSNVHFATYNSGEETYSAEITVGERTATSVQIKIKVTFKLPAGAYNAYAHKLTGKLDDTSIPKKTIVSLNRWASSSSSVRTESSTTSWITVPVSATQSTVNANLILRLYDSNDKYMSNLAHTEKNVTVNIPGY